MEGKTVIAIAHRLSTIAAMDRLIVLDQGRIVGAGDSSVVIGASGYLCTIVAASDGWFFRARLGAVELAWISISDILRRVYSSLFNVLNCGLRLLLTSLVILRNSCR